MPQKADNSAALEGAYRFFANDDFSPEAELASHFARTAERAERAKYVLVAHDTTSFNFGGAAGRAGMGPLGERDGATGFFAHYSVCFSRTGEPLGAIGLFAWARVTTRKSSREQRISQSDPDRESLRWHDAIDGAGELLHSVDTVIHVLDREGDSMELLADMRERHRRFVVRVAHDRRLDCSRKATDVEKLYDSISVAPFLQMRRVPLKRRGCSQRPVQERVFGQMPTRDAYLTLRAGTFVVSPGNGASYHLPDRLGLNFVEVIELDPPEGMVAVHWRLVTTEPIETVQQVSDIVDIYRARWQIEEFFKAAKTGCQFKTLQLETATALIVALTIYSAVAWQLLLMRWLDRNEPEAPATRALSSTELGTLRAVCKMKGKPLTNTPTTHEVMMAIARLGGHIKNNGPPGWLVLGRGFTKLQAMEQGYLAAFALNEESG